MKTCVLFLMLPILAGAQSIVLLDRAYKSPITVTETITQGQSGKWFPVYIADLDKVIRLTEQLAASINRGTIVSSSLQILPVGHSHFAITMQHAGAYSSYSISLATRSGNVGTFLQLVTQNQGSKKALQELLLFLDYLKNNRHIVGGAGK